MHADIIPAWKFVRILWRWLVLNSQLPWDCINITEPRGRRKTWSFPRVEQEILIYMWISAALCQWNPSFQNNAPVKPVQLSPGSAHEHTAGKHFISKWFTSIKKPYPFEGEHMFLNWSRSHRLPPSKVTLPFAHRHRTLSVISCQLCPGARAEEQEIQSLCILHSTAPFCLSLHLSRAGQKWWEEV